VEREGGGSERVKRRGTSLPDKEIEEARQQEAKKVKPKRHIQQKNQGASRESALGISVRQGYPREKTQV